MRLPAARLTPLGDATLVIRSLRGRMLHLAEFIHKFAMYCCVSALGFVINNCSSSLLLVPSICAVWESLSAQKRFHQHVT